MNTTDKIRILQSLSEDEIRKSVLVPLLSKMGFVDPIIHHHSGEKGKDIVCKDVDPKFGTTRYVSVIVKKGNVTGSSSGSNSYFALLNQIRQSLNEPYKHIYNLRQVEMDQCIVVITGRFLSTSLESVYGTLKVERIDKAIRETVDINRLPGLIDNYYPEYWHETENEIAALQQQRNNLLNNLSKLLGILNLDEKQRDKILRNVSTTEIEIETASYNTIRRYVANVGYKKVEIDEIDEYFTDETISNYFADIRSYFFELKQKVKSVLYNIDEPIQVLKSMLEEKSPERMVELAEELSQYIGHGGNICIGSDDIEQQDEFGSALNEYRCKKEILLNNNLIDFFHEAFAKISEKATGELKAFYEYYEKNNLNKWLGMKLWYSISKKEVGEPSFYVFDEEPVIIKNSSIFERLEIERIHCPSPGEIQVEFCVNRYGFTREESVSSEAKAKWFSSHYTSSFEKHLFSEIGLDLD